MLDQFSIVIVQDNIQYSKNDKHTQGNISGWSRYCFKIEAIEVL